LAAKSSASRKKSAKKKSTAKKTTRKKASSKKATSRGAGKKAAAKKKAPAKTKKKAAASKKAPARKKAVSKKKTSAKKKVVARKEASPKKAAGKKATPKAGPAQKKVAVRKKAAARATQEPAAAAPTPAQSTGKATAKKAEPKKISLFAVLAKEEEEAPAEKPRPAVVPAGPRAHPDAGLTRAQVKKLHERLLEEREFVLAEIRKSVAGAVEEASPFAESVDQAQHETEQNFRLRLADKQRKLLNEIQSALEKLDQGEYGVCEGTEDPIGFRRLEVSPWARYSVEYKELKDRRGL
jgi:DnaK suppressor protein